MGWNYLSIPKLQWLHHWSLGMDKWFHPTHFSGCDYPSMMGLKLNYVSKRGHRTHLNGRFFSWWHHQMETFSTLLALCEGNHRSIVDSLYKGQSFNIFFDLRLNEQLSKQSRHQWFETPSVMRSLWCHCNVISPEGYEHWHPHNWPVTTTNHLPPHLANYLGHQRVSMFV